jgi:hypothetical protein
VGAGAPPSCRFGARAQQLHMTPRTRAIVNEGERRFVARAQQLHMTPRTRAIVNEGERSAATDASCAGVVQRREASVAQPCRYHSCAASGPHPACHACSASVCCRMDNNLRVQSVWFIAAIQHLRSNVKILRTK